MSKEQTVAHETKCMIHYLDKNWSSEAHFCDVVNFIAHYTEREYASLYDELDFNIGLGKIIKNREAGLRSLTLEPTESSLIRYYDSVIGNIKALENHAGFIQRGLEGAFNYEDVVKRTLKAALKAFPELVSARPKKWHVAPLANAEIAEFDLDTALQSYAGDKSLPPRSDHFVQRVSCEYVDYQQKCQGRQPLACLVGAIYAQMAYVQIKANTQSMLLEVQHYVDQAPTQPVFNTRHLFSHTGLKMIGSMTMDKGLPTESEFIEAVEMLKAFEALDEQAKQRITRENQESILSSFDVSILEEKNKALYQKAATILEQEWSIKPFKPTAHSDDLEP